MEGLTCPHCHKVSYSASARAFSPCPHCHFRFAITEEEGHKYVIIEKEMATLISSYSDALSAYGDGFEVIVDRRETQRAFDGSDRRRVSTPT